MASGPRSGLRPRNLESLKPMIWTPSTSPNKITQSLLPHLHQAQSKTIQQPPPPRQQPRIGTTLTPSPG
ncbi:hypothetical protein HO173_012744 [Letharia columbiana]|uniref:Uncharacterized protein n=1 Tax=Letharia columbiana TaxID=112416 RepID=A0A8H6CL71_9LECA|nr:uncharacterized protein HO173_012744 [Letharia columbiana]KAF6225415.1 hypothetical protein HO173_012744 [Letharia columbiana]